ncbi:MAG: GNAT family N-acetyltransferase [Dehalococcoidia bacterium]
MSGEVAASWRVSVRPLTPEENTDAAGWLPEAWAAVNARTPDADAPVTVAALRTAQDTLWPGGQLGAIEIGGLGVSGFVVWREEPSGAGPIVAIRALAVRRDQRNLGYGVETVDRLEHDLSDRRLAAAIPRRNGLAVYFWLRAGFRPFRSDEDVERRHDPDHLWMIRSEGALLNGAKVDP